MFWAIFNFTSDGLRWRRAWANKEEVHLLKIHNGCERLSYFYLPL